VTASADPVGGQ